MPAQSSIRRGAYTLVELLVVVAVLAILVMLLLPAVNAARESARRSVCQSHLQQIGLSLQNFENAKRKYPVGARSNGTFGLSWWVEVLPFLEEEELYQRLDKRSPNNGWVLFSVRNAKATDGVVISTMRCPSSPLPPLHRASSVKIMMPSYVGISGATSHDGFPENRVTKCCSPRNDGEISAGGILLANDQVRQREILDGLSKVIVVGEASNYAWNSKGKKMRIDGGYPTGWITGTSAKGTPPLYDDGTGRPCWNLTTIRYAPNMFQYDQPGLYANRGANNPLVSAHRGGVYATMLGGAVLFLSEGMEPEVLKRLATRDDGREIKEF